MKRYYIWTVGCQMNKADSERIASALEGCGYSMAERLEEADLVILNSCVVRGSAENRVASRLSSLKKLKADRPEMHLALTGCMVDSHNDELHRRFPHVDFFFKPQAVGDLLEFIGLAPQQEVQVPSEPGACAFVPIIQGCDNFCTYCIVPYRRGREKSRPMSEIVCQVGRLVERGTREVTVLGQNVDSYGRDLPEKPDLADLLAELDAIPGLERIRFLTSHPKDMTLKLIQAVGRLPKVCEYINLPLQAGDDEILQIMRRGYSIGQYRELVETIRQEIPGVAVSTDVIVGFPGETDEQFRHTYEALAEIEFDTVHVAAYSSRTGTVAAKMQDSVPAPEKKRRLSAVEELQERVAVEINARLLGTTVEVLVEGQRGGKWFGRTRTNKLVFFRHSDDCLGRAVNVLVEKTSAWSLQGNLR